MKDINFFDIKQNCITQTAKKNPLLHVLKKNSYQSLELFKNQISLEGYCYHNNPYSIIKPSITLYRIIFSSLGILYLVLGLILFSKSLTWTSQLLFGSNFTVKSLLCGLCLFSFIYCVWLGLTLKPEREALKKIFQNGKESLTQFYERKKLENGFNIFLIFKGEHKKFILLKQGYLKALKKLNLSKENTTHILHRIALSDSDNETREELYNQAILEFRDNTKSIIHDFKQWEE